MTITEKIRFATFNVSLNRNEEGELIEDLSTPDNEQAKAIAEIIQRNNPDVILLNEFDYDPEGNAIALFQENYLEVSQNGVAPVEYPYVYLAPSNTGIPSGLELDNDGTTDGAGDAFGFGFFPGQFGMVLLSKYLIDAEEAFIIGLTIGNDDRTKIWHVQLFKFISCFIYPPKYRFERQNLSVFDLGFKYGKNIKYRNINQIEFDCFYDLTIKELRELFDLNCLGNEDLITLARFSQ